MTMRDIEQNPYTPDELRVVDFLQTLAPDIGAGDDPIGFLLACYSRLTQERAMLRALAHDHRVSSELIGIRVRNTFQ